MRVIIASDPAAAAEIAATRIAEQVRSKPESVLGLATGGTPIQCYRLLVQWHAQGQLDFSGITTFNLDEYVGLPAEHPECYRSFMQRNLFAQINIDPGNCHIPDGNAADLIASCQAYEERIRACQGIDLQLLGIGRDGHIAFNEPGSSLASRTRVKHLTAETIRDNARFFDDESEVPRLAVTMGVGTILDSRCCLLLATGTGKAEAVAAAVEGPITSSVPASALQLHPNTLMVIDNNAAAELKHADYYRLAESAQAEMEKPMGTGS